MHTRGKLPAIAAIALSPTVGCEPLQLDLTVADSSPAAAPHPIPCSQPSPCAGTSTPLCDQDAGVCVQCLSSSDCPRKSNVPHCVKNTCIACMGSTDCNDGGVGPRLCNTAIPRCTSPCGDQDADECLNISSIPEACAVNQGFPYCVECIQQGVSSECVGRAGGRYCWGLPSGACGCMDDSDCPDGGECQAPSGPQGILRFCAGWSPLN